MSELHQKLHEWEPEGVIYHPPQQELIDDFATFALGVLFHREVDATSLRAVAEVATFKFGVSCVATPYHAGRKTKLLIYPLPVPLEGE